MATKGTCIRWNQIGNFKFVRKVRINGKINSQHAPPFPYFADRLWITVTLPTRVKMTGQRYKASISLTFDLHCQVIAALFFITYRRLI